MESALNEFLLAQREVLSRELTDEAVGARCEAIVRSLEDPPTTYSEEASEHWNSIVHEMPFDWSQQVVDELRTFNAATVLQAAEDWLFDAGTRRSISLMIFSPEHEAERQTMMAKCAAAEPIDGEQFGPPGSVSHHFTIDALTALRDSLPLTSPPIKH